MSHHVEQDREGEFTRWIFPHGPGVPGGGNLGVSVARRWVVARPALMEQPEVLQEAGTCEVSGVCRTTGPNTFRKCTRRDVGESSGYRPRRLSMRTPSAIDVVVIASQPLCQPVVPIVIRFVSVFQQLRLKLVAVPGAALLNIWLSARDMTTTSVVGGWARDQFS